MKAEFYKDDNNYIWFYYARNIHMRKNKHRNLSSHLDAKKKEEQMRENRENAKKELV